MGLLNWRHSNWVHKFARRDSYAEQCSSFSLCMNNVYRRVLLILEHIPSWTPFTAIVGLVTNINRKHVESKLKTVVWLNVFEKIRSFTGKNSESFVQNLTYAYIFVYVCILMIVLSTLYIICQVRYCQYVECVNDGKWDRWMNADFWARQTQIRPSEWSVTPKTRRHIQHSWAQSKSSTELHTFTGNILLYM